MKKIIILSIILVFCLSSCTSCVKTIGIKNMSNSDIVVCYTCSDILSEEGNDSLWNLYYKQKHDLYPPFVYYENCILKKDSIRYIPFLYKHTINEFCKDSLIRFFFIDYFVFKNYSLDTIAKYQTYEQKMIFSNKDLEKRNWIIEYK